jgi:hypothetical protein
MLVASGGEQVHFALDLRPTCEARSLCLPKERIPITKRAGFTWPRSTAVHCIQRAFAMVGRASRLMPRSPRSKRKPDYEARFTMEALTQIAAIHSYIQARSPVAASHIVARIFQELRELRELR